MISAVLVAGKETRQPNKHPTNTTNKRAYYIRVCCVYYSNANISELTSISTPLELEPHSLARFEVASASCAGALHTFNLCTRPGRVKILNDMWRRGHTVCGRVVVVVVVIRTHKLPQPHTISRLRATGCGLLCSVWPGGVPPAAPDTCDY